MSSAVSLRQLSFAWPGAAPLLEIDELDIALGERVFLRGPSGSGKSTLLGLIAGVLEPTGGKLSVLGEDMGRLGARQRDALRARNMGVVFQMFNLLPFLNVVQNVTLGCAFSKDRRSQLNASSESEAATLLARLGLEGVGLLGRRVSDLSVGQQQRVAVARALLGGPKLVIADEPTSALDSDARDQFLALLTEEVSRTGAALLMVSHDASLAGQFDRSLDLQSLNRAAKPVSL